MNKISEVTINKISESNNNYRNILNDLFNKIDQKTTNFVSNLVTESNYVVDFSKAVNESKEMVNKINNYIEDYVIKDLRNVEDVNEQFINKINEKIDNVDSNNDDFKNSLNNLLNDKYLEIVKIKRKSFLNENNNEDIERIIDEFVDNIINEYNFNANNSKEEYKAQVYEDIIECLNDINNLYLNSFRDSIINCISSDKVDDDFLNIPEIPNIEDEVLVKENNISDDLINIPEIPEYPNEVDMNLDNLSNLLSEPEIEPVEMEPEINNKIKAVEPKKTYDVEEILKIAKSPVVSLPTNNEVKKDDFVDVKPLEKENNIDKIEAEFDEKEIVEELISRLNNRLKLIDERQAKIDEEQKKIDEDEAFVNDLITSSNNKKEKLLELENELNLKEKELDEKEKQLEKKINDIMPFADAVLNSTKES